MSANTAEPMTASDVAGSLTEAQRGSVHLGELAQPMRNGSCSVIMHWEAVRRPMKVCESGGWYTRHPTETRWVLRTWMDHKSSPGGAWPKVAEARDADLAAMVAAAAERTAKAYGLQVQSHLKAES